MEEEDISFKNYFSFPIKAIKIILSMEKSKQICGFVIILGFFLLFSPIIFIKMTFYYDSFAEISITMGWGMISMGFAILSLLIAHESKKIAKDSDKKMDAFAISTFQEILDDFENESIFIGTLILKDSKIWIANESGSKFYFNRHIRIRKGSVWKCRKHIMRAKNLKHWVKPQEQDRLAKLLNDLIKKLPWESKTMQIIYEEAMNITGSCIDICDFKISKENNEKIKNLFTEYIAERRDSEVDTKEFYENVSKELYKIAPDKQTRMNTFNKLSLDDRDRPKI